MISLARFAEILFRHWVQFLILLILLPGALSVASIAFFRTHQAQAALWVESPNYFGDAATPTGWNQYLTPAQNQVDSLWQMVQTRAFRDRLATSLVDTGTVSAPERDSLLNAMLTDFKVKATGSHLVNISFTCERPAVCVGVITAAIDLYHDRLAQLQRQDADLATSFLTTELLDAQSTLKNSEDALQRYLVEHPTETAALAASDAELDRLTRQVELDRQQVNGVQDRLSGVKYNSAAAARVVDTMAGVIDPPRIIRSGISGGPTARKRAVLAVLACWAAAIAYLVLLTWLDRNARDPQELERRLKVPVLATIPHFSHLGRT